MDTNISDDPARGGAHACRRNERHPHKGHYAWDRKSYEKIAKWVEERNRVRCHLNSPPATEKRRRPFDAAA